MNIFAKDYASNWSEERFVIKKVKNNVQLTYVISDLNINCWNVLGKRTAKDKPNKLKVEKVIKRNSDKLYFNWKCYNISFIDKKDFVM